MKKTTQIHIGGRHFFMDEDAYQKIHHYIESLKAHFSADGETGKEIVEDIEQRIAELLENSITKGKQSVTLEDVSEAIRTLGTVEDFVYEGKSEGNQENDYNRKDYRRFFRDPDNYYLGGVASGLAEYFVVDPLWIRLAFVALVLLKGAGLLIYLILWIVVPKARSTAEKLQMKGKPVNLSTIKDTVNEEFEKARTGSSNIYAKGADRTRNTLESMMRAIGLVIVAVFKFMLAGLGVLFLVLGSFFLALFIMMILGFTNVFGHFQLWNDCYIPDLSNFFIHSGYYYAAVIALAILILIPIATLIYAGVKILFNIKTRHPILRAFLLTSWILALILFITLIIANVPNSPIESSGSETTEIAHEKYTRMIIDANDNLESSRMTHYQVFGHRFKYSSWDDALYEEAKFHIVASEDDKIHVNISKKVKNVDMHNAQRYLERVGYRWVQQDSALILDRYFHTGEDDFWMFAHVDVHIKIPAGQQVIISEDVCDMLEQAQKDRYCRNLSLAGKPSVMTAEGSLVPVK